MQKKHLIILIAVSVAFVLVGSIVTTVSAASYSLTLTGPSTVTPGNTFVVSGMYMKDGVGVADVSIDIFDVTSGGTVCSGCHVVHDDPGSTSIWIGTATTGPGGVYSMTVGPYSDGDYAFKAIAAESSVNHPSVESGPLNVHVAAPTPVSVVEHTEAIQQTIKNDVPATAFKNPNMAGAFNNKLSAVINDINAGNYANAISKLQKDLIPKTDGCAVSNAPDSNDWVKTCPEQAQIYPQLISLLNELQQL